MLLNKITIIGELAHFKIPYAGKQQRTYRIPPPSTVIGILKNLYGTHINNFIFGYTFTADDNLFKDIQKIYKEINLNVISESGRYNGQKWNSDVCEIQYLCNPVLTIYTDINDELIVEECLNLGKTDCLATIKQVDKVELVDIEGEGFYQWTTLDVGDGIIERVSMETVYNGQKGIYDVYSAPLRFNKSFKLAKHHDKDQGQSVFLWHHEKEGVLSAV